MFKCQNENGRTRPRRRLRTEADLWSGVRLVDRVHYNLRRSAWAALGSLRQPPRGKLWVQFQFYHWILEDQRETFKRQLQSLRSYGDFITLDEAIAVLNSPSGTGHYFCLTFDDGFRNCLENAVPVLSELGVPAAFFVPTQFIGLDLDRHWDQLSKFYRQSWSEFEGGFEFLDWDECRQLTAAGFTVGSHTHSHARLAQLTKAEAESELTISKQILESELGVPCRHFCCPWGKARRDYDPEVHPAMARRLGYASFLTTQEGVNLRGDSPFELRRNGCEPDFEPSMLRYALFPSARAKRDDGHLLARSSALTTVPGEAEISVSETNPVEVEKFPYPFQAGLTVTSDTDGATVERLRAVHQLFCGTEVLRRGERDWRALGLSEHSQWYDEAHDGIQGLGLELADSFFLIGDKTTLGLYQPSHGESFKEDDRSGQDAAALLKHYLKEGRLDTFHSFHQYTRQQLHPLLSQFYEWCEREQVAKPSVWTNHSYAGTPTGLCPKGLQPARLRRLARLSGRKLIGPFVGRKPFPLRFALARYQGDWPGSRYYVNDLLAANGLRYVWLNMEDLYPNRIILPERQVNSRETILESVTMEDGVRYYRFPRCYGKPRQRLGGEAYLRDSENGFDASCILTDGNLESLCTAGGTCILYTHWAHSRSMPVSDLTIGRFDLLRRWRDAGKVWVTSTARLLEWTRRRTFLKVHSRREGRRLIIEIAGVADPIFGWAPVTLCELDGLCLRLPSSRGELTVALHDREIPAEHVHVDGDLCWLDAHARN